MKDYLRRIDTNTQGPRYDVTPLFADHKAFSSLVDEMLVHFADVQFDYVAAIDALGFVLGAAIALRGQKGLVPTRKAGKLPVPTMAANFVDYTGKEKSLKIRTDAISPGTRVLVVDEWIETGAQVQAAIELIEQQGGIVAGIASINIDKTILPDDCRKNMTAVSFGATRTEPSCR